MIPLNRIDTSSSLAYYLESNAVTPVQEPSSDFAELITQKNSPNALWNCIDCGQDTYGGHRFTFEYKKQFESWDAFRSQSAKIFPAVQAAPNMLGQLNPCRCADLSTLCEQSAECIRESLETPLAGFTYTKVRNCEIISMPDLGTQRLIWNTIKPKLPAHIQDKPVFDLLLLEVIITHIVSIREILPPVFPLQLSQSERDDFEQLGFSYLATETGILLSLPDREALTARWNRLREKQPNRRLCELSIAISDGVADDMSFVSSLLSHDGLISSSSEFVHDLTVHCFSLIRGMLSKGKSYQKNRRTFRKIISEGHAILSAADQMLERSDLYLPESFKASMREMREPLQASLGAFADELSLHISNPTETFNSFSIESIWGSEGSMWPSYWERRFPEKPLNSSSISILTELLVDASDYKHTGRFRPF